MNIKVEDIPVLKECKRIVEKIKASGKLPNNIEDLQDLWTTWNKVFRKNEKMSSCPTCKQQKFLQLKRTYDIYGLKDQFNGEEKSSKKTKSKGQKKKK